MARDDDEHPDSPHPKRLSIGEFFEAMKPSHFLLMAGLMTVQHVGNIHTTHDSADKVSREVSKLKDAFQASLVDREKYFLRKSDFKEITDRLQSMEMKVDRLSLRVGKNHSSIDTALFSRMPENEDWEEDYDDPEVNL